MGGGPGTTLGTNQYGPLEIAIDSTNAYWTNQGSGTVMKGSVGGGTPAPLAANQSSPHGIAVDATSVYWTNNGDGTVMKVPIAGGTPKVIAYVYGGQGTINVPSWSPDSKRLAFVSNTDK